MPTLPDELFSLLENKTLAAREGAEKAARNVLAFLKVESGTWWGSKEDSQRELWLGLRARARQFGLSIEESEVQDPVKRGIPQLIEEIAYEQWHRMLFARFLAENDLLMHPSGVPVSLQDCEELAQKEGEDDAWRLAAKYASVMLPGIFKLEDPCACVRLMPNDHHNLEKILLDIPRIVFTCDDALGWMYQFWQSKKKDEVNASERKIGGADLPPVTQLFTEDYMVRFLLENSLGAWWAGRHPESPLIKEWEYLRFKEDGTPAAGTFPGWPDRAAEVTIMDPCCGSGHFLVAAFGMLHRMRIEEEHLDSTTATTATLRDNIFGLEIDQRCTQIAGFALSLVGWKTGGYQKLPELNVACTGIAVQGQLESWLELANGDSRLKAGLERLYKLFKNAPDLGSLINPGVLPDADRMFVADYEQVKPLFEKALANEKSDAYDQVSMSGADLVKAAQLLNGKYVLVSTNVPFLGNGKQKQSIKDFGRDLYPDSTGDLATLFMSRILDFCLKNGSCSVVLPQNMLFQKTYQRLRKRLITTSEINGLLRLGSFAFRTIGGEVVNVILITITNQIPDINQVFFDIDVSTSRTPNYKREECKKISLVFDLQKDQVLNPNHIIISGKVTSYQKISDFATVHEGLHTGDYVRFGRKFWELPSVFGGWVFQQGSPTEVGGLTGREHILFWENGEGELIKYVKERLNSETISMWIKGFDAWGKNGIAISPMSDLKATLYSGELFTHSAVVIIPKKPEYLYSLWKYSLTDEFRLQVRKLDKNLAVAVATFRDVPFSISIEDHDSEFQNITANMEFVDPTQWVFLGNFKLSKYVLQVFIARILDYSWPRQPTNEVFVFIDRDGIVCLPAINGEAPASERLRIFLAAVFENEWTTPKLGELLDEVGYSGRELSEWLRDGFFDQHCKLFQSRPFIWHIWDGRKDGFSALVNYHKLDHANLEKLTYTYLGSWIADRKSDMNRGIAGAEGRLLAAQALQDKLKLILEGEPPYDIYVRWKPLHEQPVGWNPDLNDGVRLNIRPFVTAGILRSKFTINWNKDRGMNPDGSERLNDLHYSNAEKIKARGEYNAISTHG
jgi:type I restriction-modification system DNA methylase subunit